MENTKEISVKEKKPMKKRTKIFLEILAAFFIILILFVAVTTIISVIGVQSNINKAKSFGDAGCVQLEVENTDNGYWTVKSDDGLNVMQLTDVHIGGGWMSIKKDSMAINSVASMIMAEKPDLVIVTGDVSYPVPFQAGTFNNKSGAKIFAELMESLGVYWTLSYGNHDTEAYSYYTREQLTDFYSGDSYPHCLLQNGPENVDGSGNQIFNVVNSDGIITRSLITLDSHSYVDGDYFGALWYYDNIHNNQIEWYKNCVAQNAGKNEQQALNLDPEKQAAYASLTQTVPSSVFFHIPMSEFRDAWAEYVTNGYNDTENVKYKYGIAGETGKIVYSGVHEDDLFETMLEMHSTDSVFCGHDHYNNFSVNYKGINLTYGMSVDYLAYAGIYQQGTQRGCTMISYDPMGAISFRQENYYQDKYTAKYEKEKVEMQEFTTITADDLTTTEK